MNRPGLVILWAISLCVMFSLPCRAAGGKLVLLVVDGLDVRDVTGGTDLANLRRLLVRGAVGAMNISTGGARNSANACVTLGAGSRAVGSQESAGVCLDADEEFRGMKAAVIYAQLTGRPARGAVLCPAVSLLADENSRLPQAVRPGLLGSTLRAAGVQTAAVGNADTAFEPRRYAAAIAMDAEGQVAWGCVGKTILKRDEAFPFHLCTDELRLLEQLDRALAQADFVVVDWGDVARLEAYRPVLVPMVFSQHRRDALRRFDRFLGQVLARVDLSRDLVLVLSPCVSGESALRGELLAPVIAGGAGLSPGVLVSGSTRHPGLVTNVDIAPTVLAHFGLRRVYPMIGEAIRVAASVDPLRTVENLCRRAATSFVVRPIFIRSYVLVELAVATAAVFTGLGVLGGARPLRFLLLAVSAAPLVFLILPLFYAAEPTLLVLAGWVAAFILTFGLLRLWRDDWEAAFGMTALVTAATILADATVGGRLAIGSPLGHCLVGGARFYGVGNEHAGVVVGSVLAAGTLAMDRFGLPGRRAALFLAPIFALVSLFTVHPFIGANLGAGAAAAVGLGTGVVLLWRRRFHWRDITAVAMFALLTVGGTVALHACGARENWTHMGKALESLRYGGMAELSVLVQRKVGMNLKLLRYTVWSRALMGLLVVMVFILWWPGRIGRRALARRPAILAGMVGALAASTVGFVANDSGVVLAATALIHPAGLLLGVAMAGRVPRPGDGPAAESDQDARGENPRLSSREGGK